MHALLKGKPWRLLVGARRSLRPFRLRWRRLRTWREVASFAHGTTAADLFRMVVLAGRALLRRPPAGVVARYRVCVRCEFHDRAQRACLGCGCYMPYKLAAGGRCWAREQDPRSGYGFD